jgi:hypothetical protein
MAQPELGGSEFEHGEEVGGVFFVTGGETAEVVDPAEEPFDTIAGSVEHGTEAGFQRRWTVGGMLGAAPAASI